MRASPNGVHREPLADSRPKAKRQFTPNPIQTAKNMARDKENELSGVSSEGPTLKMRRTMRK
jgi:hypothetical protein